MKRIFLSFFIFVIISMLMLQFGLGAVAQRLVEAHLQKEIVHYYRELTRGVFHVMLSELRNVEEVRWKRHVTEWQPQFGFPVQLLTLSAAQWTEEEAGQLERGLIVVRGMGDIFFKRIDESSYVLQLGPFEEFEGPIGFKVNVLVWSCAIVMVGLLTLLWVFPFWRKLKTMRGAAIAFGNGDFSTRAKLPRQSSLFPVAEAFNRMAERIQQLIDSHRELTRAVSHELRTPLARIRFSLEMLTSAATPEQRRSHGEGIQKDLDELETMITELLTYARFDGQVPELRRQSCPLVPWLRETAAYVAMELERVDFNFCAPEDGSEIMARFEPRYLGHVVTNLLLNAARYARKRVDLIVEHTPETILIHVDDDGPGIPESFRDRIFEPFTRLDESRSRSSGGFGLGLAIVRRVIEWHGGRATATQSPLGGSRFTIQWPAGIHRQASG